MLHNIQKSLTACKKLQKSDVYGDKVSVFEELNFLRQMIKDTEALKKKIEAIVSFFILNRTDEDTSNRKEDENDNHCNCQTYGSTDEHITFDGSSCCNTLSE